MCFTSSPACYRLLLFLAFLTGLFFHSLLQANHVTLMFPLVSACGQPIGVSWSCHDIVAASSDADRSPLQLRWSGTCFQTPFRTQCWASTTSDRHYKTHLFRRNGTRSALEATRNALYKSTATTTTTTTRPGPQTIFQIRSLGDCWWKITHRPDALLVHCWRAFDMSDKYYLLTYLLTYFLTHQTNSVTALKELLIASNNTNTQYFWRPLSCLTQSTRSPRKPHGNC